MWIVYEVEFSVEGEVVACEAQVKSEVNIVRSAHVEEVRHGEDDTTDRVGVSVCWELLQVMNDEVVGILWDIVWVKYQE